MSLNSRSMSLRRAIVLVVAIGLLLPALLFNGYSWLHRYRSSIADQTHELLWRDAAVLSTGMQEPLWNINNESAAALVEAMMARNDDIIRIEVRDKALGVLTYDERPERRVGYTARAETPVVYQGETIGTVNLEVGSARLHRTLRDELAMSAIGLGAQALLSIVLILILLEHRLVRPLRRLGAGAERLENYQLDVPFTWKRLDEIGVLGRRLESTRISLQALVQELDHKNRALERDLEHRKQMEQERRHAEEKLRYSEQQFAMIFESSPVAMFVTKLGSVIENVNLAFEKLFLRDRASAFGKDTAELELYCDPRDRVNVVDELANTGSTSMASRDIWMFRGDGSRILIQYSGHTFRQGGESYAILACWDVTDKRRIESEIRELNATLEQRVVARTEELQRANVDLASTLETLRVAQEELSRNEKLAALGAMVAGIAHELNTPIGNSLIVASTLADQTKVMLDSYASGLKRSVLEKYMDDAAKASDIMVRNLHRAADLVTGFKQVAVDQTSSQRRRFLLSEVVAENLLTLWPTLKKTRFTVKQDIPHNLEMDSFPGPLGQVLTNLVNNALVHAFDGRGAGTITIVARFSLNNDEDWIELSVADDGAGIPQAHLGRIFDPFFTTRLGSGGTGLGLNIVHNIVTNVLGGRIRVQSETGRGSTFIISMPKVAPQKQPDDGTSKNRLSLA